jgi:hypothetical protein
LAASSNQRLAEVGCPPPCTKLEIAEGAHAVEAAEAEPDDLDPVSDAMATPEVRD